MAFIDDSEAPLIALGPSDNVYSYFIFAPPTEEKKEGAGWTFDIVMAYVLMVTNFFFQGFLLWVIYNVVVSGNIEWQNSIVRMEGGGLDMLNYQPQGKCNPGGSMCFKGNDTYSCAPPSVQLTGRWEELDTDGDGIWTREEVEKAKEALQCKYIVNPVEVFDVFINFLKSREKILWLHPDVKAGKKIHKPYFWFAAGDIIMCGYRNELMCPNLLQRGFFHGPLKHHTAPRVGTTIDSALKYCYELLKPGGTCVRTLPSTYSVWKISSTSQCKAPSFEKFVYKNPGSGIVKSLLAVSWEAVDKFALSKTTVFRTYKWIIISLWLLSMFFEFKDITIVFTWVMRFPDAKELEANGEEAIEVETPEDGGDPKYIIKGVSSGHRMTVGVMNFCRTILTLVLTYVGVSFLLKQTSYIGLLMDAVSLVFIVEIAIILYGQVLRPEIRDQVEGLDSMEVEMYGIDFLNRRKPLIDFISLVVIMVFTVTLMHFFNQDTVIPIYDTLNCACNSLGDNCLEAKKFSYDFWHKYWTEDVPNVFKAVDELKGGAASVLAEIGQRRFHTLPSTLLSAH